jgi:hypothetical protein
MATCKDCGDEVDNYDNGNRPRDRCWSCIEAEAQLGDETNPFRYLADKERAEGTLTTRVDDDPEQTTL